MTKRILAIAVLAVCIAGVSGSAMADDIDVLLHTNGFATCPTYGCATVNVHITNSSSATITVVSLLNGYQFDNFGFNLVSTSSITGFSATVAGVSNPSGDSLSGMPTGGSYNLNGFGNFDFLYNTGLNGGSTGSNCVVTVGSGGTTATGSTGCKFVLTLTGAGLSLNAFNLVSGGNAAEGNVLYAGHLASASCTGYVGGGQLGTSGTETDTGTTGTGGACGTTTTPEPAGLMLLGSGLSAMGLLFRRKRK